LKVAFDVASCASKGARAYQEDYALIRPLTTDLTAKQSTRDGLVAVLADGMGGHAGGALASETACTVFASGFLAMPGEVRVRLFEALYQANEAISARVVANPALTGMGCTLVGMVVGSSGIEWVSVGDSPLFLIRDGEIVLLNEDHSLAPEIDKLAAAGKISPESAKADPRRHFLRSAVTGGEIELIDRSRRPLALMAGDVIILASDGIHTLAQGDILGLVQRQANNEAESIARSLLDAVNAVGDKYQDNTTVVVVRVAE
jgi:PPM family protein phosphatase